jgi:protein-disulfide isomerase
MKRMVLVSVLAAACWSSQPARTADPAEVERLSRALAASQQEVATLKRQLREATAARDEAATLEAKIKALEASLAAPPPASPAAPVRRSGPDAAKTYAIELGSWPQRGPADAKVTIVFVHDYACPYCEKSRATLDDLVKKYGKDLRIVYRPIIIRPRQSAPSALAACAAGRQKRYDKLEPLLWEKGFHARNYDTDATAPDGTTQSCWLAPAGCPIVIGFATEIGLDLRRFKADMQSCDAVVHDSMAELTALGVAATPTFFINGRYTAGAQPIEQFATLIDEEKLKAEQRIRQGTPKARYYQEWVLARGEKTLTP